MSNPWFWSVLIGICTFILLVLHRLSLRELEGQGQLAYRMDLVFVIPILVAGSIYTIFFFVLGPDLTKPFFYLVALVIAGLIGWYIVFSASREYFGMRWIYDQYQLEFRGSGSETKRGYWSDLSSWEYSRRGRFHVLKFSDGLEIIVPHDLVGLTEFFQTLKNLDLSGCNIEEELKKANRFSHSRISALAKYIGLAVVIHFSSAYYIRENAMATGLDSCRESNTDDGFCQCYVGVYREAMPLYSFWYKKYAQKTHKTKLERERMFAEEFEFDDRAVRVCS